MNLILNSDRSDASFPHTNGTWGDAVRGTFIRFKIQINGDQLSKLNLHRLSTILPDRGEQRQRGDVAFDDGLVFWNPVSRVQPQR